MTALPGIGMDQIAGAVLLLWLIGAFALMAGMVGSGRGLADELAARHPEEYEALGRPRPGYLESVRRTEFAQFVAQRRYENLNDPQLSARFEEYRSTEKSVLVFILKSLIFVVALVMIARKIG